MIFDFLNKLNAKPRNKNLRYLKDLNDVTLEYIRLYATDSQFQQALLQLTCRDIDDVESLTRVYKKNGVVVVPDFLDQSICKELLQLVEATAKRGKSDLSEYFKSGLEFRRYRRKTPEEFIVHCRNGFDSGMIDFFNFDKQIPEEVAENIRSKLMGDALIAMLTCRSKKAGFKLNINAYLNAEVTETRGFHIDARYPTAKAFIYLTDVSSLDDGPYTYVKNTTATYKPGDINSVLAKRFQWEDTEMPVVPLADIVPVLGKAGTLIISDQSGMHRGLPQGLGRKRVALVGKYLLTDS